MVKGAVYLFGLVLAVGEVSAEATIWLDELDLSAGISGWGVPQAKRSVGCNPLSVNGMKFDHGVGMRTDSYYVLDVGGNALAFEAKVGVDDGEPSRYKRGVIFHVYADNRLVAQSKRVGAGQPPLKIKADLSGAKLAILHVTSCGGGMPFEHADWCDAFFIVKRGTVIRPSTDPLTVQVGVLTPSPSRFPRINGARIYGVRPGSPVLFTVASTGDRPMSFSAKGLPPSLSLDSRTGRITGTVITPGCYRVTLAARNNKGMCERVWRLIVGDKIALTPPMGWNSWNCFAHAVSDEKIRQAADAMVLSGLINHGWTYINIDDFWQTRSGEKSDASLMGEARDAGGRILPNKRFPDMKALADYVHGLGLKIGLYSSPGPTSCGGCIGSWQHEEQDARTYAEWGYDYLKYDWCSYAHIVTSENVTDLARPYMLMGTCLRAQKRDIVYSLCQYGMGDVSAWGKNTGGQCWRTTYDITDTWGSMTGILDKQSGLECYAGPSRWNDPDMLIIGMVGWGNLHPTRLKHNEQLTHVSLWALLCAPLLIGCDMTQLDAFTLGLLTNDEVIEINQDPLGKQAKRVVRYDSGGEVWAKCMEDGSLAVGLVNRNFLTTRVPVDFRTLGLSGKQRVRDLWRQRDEGVFNDCYEAKVFGHCTKLVRFFQNDK